MAQAYTVEQALALAPDPASAAAARGLVNPSKWVSVGVEGDAIWGECRGSGSSPYQVCVDLTEPAFKCTCPSRKFPCKHGLAVLLRWAGDPASIPATARPPWVAQWFEGRAARAAKKAAPAVAKESDPVAQAKRAERREARVADGVEELEVWLGDLMRQGLAAAKAESTAFWSRMAARLVDAQAPGLARYVQSLSELCASGDGWQDRTMRQAGRLHLLLCAWRRLEALPPDLREDVRSLVGFAQSKEEVLALPSVHDTWFVWAQYVEPFEGSLQVQRTWLVGLESGRTALGLSFGRPGQGFELSLAPGSAYDADVVFYPSSVPRRILVKSHGAPFATEQRPAFASFGAALAAYGAELSRNPWIEAFPMAVRDARLAVTEERFTLVDKDCRTVRLRATGEALWMARAVTGGQPATFFGEWDESLFTLLAVDAGGVFKTLRT